MQNSRCINKTFSVHDFRSWSTLMFLSQLNCRLLGCLQTTWNYWELGELNLIATLFEDIIENWCRLIWDPFIWKCRIISFSFPVSQKRLYKKWWRHNIRFRFIKFEVCFWFLNLLFTDGINDWHLHLKWVRLFNFRKINCFWPILTHHEYTRSRLKLDHIFPSETKTFKNSFVVFIKELFWSILDWI